VLATGLSALYSSLPHKIRPEGHEEWYRIEKEHYLHMPDVQMIVNCLEFCNAVVQVTVYYKLYGLPSITSLEE